MEQKRDNRDEQTDEVLISRTLAGEREAFGTLLLRYLPSVQRLCVRLLRETLEAQDVAQEAALQAFLGLRRLQEPARFGAWFHAIAANLARSALRKRSDLSLHILTDESSIQMLWSASLLSLEEIQMAREIHDEILAALQELSLVNRQAVIGFYLQGYSYAELAQLLGVSVSTVKGRLFQGRQQLKTSLQPLAPIPYQALHRKDCLMTTTKELVKLEIDSLRTLLLTQQNFALLRDPISGRGLPIRLTPGEAEALALARPMRLYKDAPQIPQDLSLRLLAALGAQVQQIVINTLAEQAFYATLTFLQGGQSHELDVRLSEALIVAGYTEAPIYATGALLEAATQLDLSSSRNVSEMQELVEKAKNVQQLNREERLSLEESLRTAQAAHNRKKVKKLPERLWPFLLEGLTGSRSDISLAELRAIDPVTAFTPREVVWDEQPMTAIKLPDEHEALWLLVRPEIWNEITRGLGDLQQAEPAEEQAAEITRPLAEPLAEAVKQKVEERLAQLVTSDELRTALLLNPKGELIAWNGPDPQATLLHFTTMLNNDLSQHAPLANEQELNRQLGHQPQKATFYGGNKKAIMETLPAEIGGVMVTQIYQGWKLVVIFAHKPARDLGKDIHQRIHQTGSALTEILSQA